MVSSMHDEVKVKLEGISNEEWTLLVVCFFEHCGFTRSGCRVGPNAGARCKHNLLLDGSHRSIFGLVFLSR